MSPARPRRGLRDSMQLRSDRPAATETADQAATAPEVATATAKTATTATGSKFTVILSPEDAATFDQLALDLRRVLGRRVAKGDLVRALVVLAADDATLRDQLIRELSR